jgi:phenylacetate-CoA ligase
MWHKKIQRKLTLALLNRAHLGALLRRSEQYALSAFHSAATKVPAYQAILATNKIDPRDIRTISDFKKICPLLNKNNTFASFPLSELCQPEAMSNLAGVLTSSGHGARFGYGLSTRKQTKQAIDAIDLGLEYAFKVDSKKTLLINCLPMGVRFSSNSVTVAETSVREDMAVAIATEFGRYFDQLILVGDPLFLKLLTDYARDRNVDWQQQRINLIIGEETFGEHYRNYLAQCFCVNPDDPATGLIGSSMGVGELGLNLFYETADTVRLRRLAHANPVFFEALFGLPPQSTPLPMLFVYNPLRSFVETVGLDAGGYGELTISMLDPEIPLPLLRYQTGDVAKLLLPDDIAKACAQAGLPPPGKLSLPLIALKGRSKDQLPDNTHVGQYKDALYADYDSAVKLTSAFRLEFLEAKKVLHVQLRKGVQVETSLAECLSAALPASTIPVEVKLWSYDQFPYGMTLDYERKFNYYLPTLKS